MNSLRVIDRPTSAVLRRGDERTAGGPAVHTDAPRANILHDMEDQLVRLLLSLGKKEKHLFVTIQENKCDCHEIVPKHQNGFVTFSSVH